jgi:6-phosphofructokinase 1
MSNIRNIAVMTSGGDAPGMNACIRAVVRTGLYHGLNVFGIMRGYQGMIEGDIFQMQTQSVSNIIQRGGTILKTARSKEFTTPEGRQKAYDQLKAHNIDGLVLIGGDGTFRGAVEFFKQFNIPAIGIPGTIDKDMAGTDYTIGFDTAVNTAVEAIDKIRDTADAHDRLFVVEVMGRDAGYIALHSGLACGAEAVLIPEIHTDIDSVINQVNFDNKRKKLTQILVVAEGDDFGGADEVAKTIKKNLPDADLRVTILGHIQRGGSPSCQDRILASRLGYAAVEGLLHGKSQQMVGIINDHIHFTPLEKAAKQKQRLQKDMVEMIKVLAS